MSYCIHLNPFSQWERKEIIARYEFMQEMHLVVASNALYVFHQARINGN